MTKMILLSISTIFVVLLLTAIIIVDKILSKDYDSDNE